MIFLNLYMPVYVFQFFTHNTGTTKSITPNELNKPNQELASCPSTSQIIASDSNSSKKNVSSSSRRNSLDLYEEAATILGLTCSQTDSCQCLECQVRHYKKLTKA